MFKLPVVAAVVNYNMAQSLQNLLSQVVRQGYDAVFVLDDASTDNSHQIAARFPNVRFVAGKTNKGAGGNRNRILEALSDDAIVHFLDADVILETDDDNMAKLVRQVAPDEPFGFVGGFIRTPSGMQQVWNYGGGIGLRSGIASLLQAALIEPNLLRHPQRVTKLRQQFAQLLHEWPDPLAPPSRRTVFWCAEANLVVRSDIFKALGGFDESYRETEILDLALRMHQKNLPCYFDPRLSVRHTAVQVRKYNRNLVKLKELIRVNRQFGLWQWLVHDGRPVRHLR